MSTKKLLVVFGAFLMIAGVVGWASTGFTAKGKTAIGSGAVTGTLMLVCGLVAGRPGWRMAGERAGLGFAVVFGGVFVWRAVMAWLQVADGQPKLAVAGLLSTMAAVAIGVRICLGGVLAGKISRR